MPKLEDGIMYKVEPQDIVDAQMAFYSRVHPGVIPQKLTRLGNTVYSYEHIFGAHPCLQVELSWVYNAAYAGIWYHLPQVPIGPRDRSVYWEYCYHAAKQLGFQFTVKTRHKWYGESLTSVATAHQDMTLENVLLAGKQVVFIDPGVSRGIICQEIDEAKLMQSVITQYEAVRRGWGFCTLELPFEPRFAHLFLLATHWIRLLRHPKKHTVDVSNFGTNFVVPQLLEMLKHASSSDRFGYRRSLSELQAKCVQVLSYGIPCSRSTADQSAV